MALTTEDKLAIVELCSRFDRGVDSNDVRACIDTFAEDGSLETSYGSASGKVALKDFLTELESGFSKGKRHLAINHIIEGDGESAQMTSYLAVIEREKAPNIIATGVFADTLEKIDGNWKFARRHLEIDPSWQP